MEPLRATPSELPVEAVFSIYSITKTLIAIDVLRLAATGAVAANDARRPCDLLVVAVRDQGPNFEPAAVSFESGD